MPLPPFPFLAAYPTSLVFYHFLHGNASDKRRFYTDLLFRTQDLNAVRFLSPILASASVAAGAMRSTSVVDSRNQVISPSITIQVQGNATLEGVDALYNNIEKKFFRSFRKILK